MMSKSKKKSITLNLAQSAVMQGYPKTISKGAKKKL
jgi:hypothetical protein